MLVFVKLSAKKPNALRAIWWCILVWKKLLVKKKRLYHNHLIIRISFLIWLLSALGFIF